MSLGPEKIILILVVALIVFGPHRLPDIARQVGTALRELRRMQDTVRGELEQVLHPDLVAPPAPAPHPAAFEDTDHATLPPGAGSNGAGSNGAGAASDMTPYDMTAPDATASHAAVSDGASENVSDDGFAGPRSFT